MVAPLLLSNGIKFVGTAIAAKLVSDGFDWMVGQAGAAACDAYSADPSPGDGIPGLDSMMHTMCSGYWAATDDIPPLHSVPFQGGQCAVRYQVSYESKFNSTDIRCDPSDPSTSFYCDREFDGTVGNILGPIQAPVFAQAGDGTGSWKWYGVNATQTGSSNRIATGSSSGTGVDGFYTLVSSSIVREDGLSDNCGNIAPVPRPSPNPSGPGRWGEPLVVIQPITNIPVTVIPIVPIVNIDASINLNVNIGGITIDLFGDGNGGGGGGGGGTPPTGGGGAGGGTPIVGGGPGAPGEETFPDPPEGKEWIGCVLEVEIPEAYGKIVGTAPAEILPRTIGNARLVYETSDLSFDGFTAPNHPIREAAFTLIRQHKGLKVVGVYVNIPEDVTILITPIYADIETVTTD